MVKTETRVAMILCSSMYEIMLFNLINTKNGAKNMGHPLLANEYPCGSLPNVLTSLAYQKYVKESNVRGTPNGKKWNLRIKLVTIITPSKKKFFLKMHVPYRILIDILKFVPGYP